MKEPGAVPKISRPLLRLFGKYAAGYLGRHFHSIRCLQPASLPNDAAGPLVVFLNHAAWWDPLICLFLAREFFPGRPAFGPMEATALERYGFFKKLGFFPVESGTTRGAAQFLRTSNAILEEPANLLFLTPQGEFTDVRAPLHFAPGIERLAARAAQARFLPLAIEYPFWEERKPEVLLALGEALPAGAPPLAERLAATQAQLAAAAQRRQPNDWRLLAKRTSGVGAAYDLWRRARARLRGEAFRADHSPL